MQVRDVRKIERRPLRDDVFDAILERIYAQVFAPGEYINDVTVSEELGVSRTPVREALLRLEREGIVAAEMGRGFVVRPLDIAEIRDLYPIVWTLEGLGLELLPALSSADIKQLRRLNERFHRANEALECLSRDDEFHSVLLARCNNPHLMHLVHQVKRRLRRYELEYMAEGHATDDSARVHEEIIAALERRDTNAARRALERNWRLTLDLVDSWLNHQK